MVSKQIVQWLPGCPDWTDKAIANRQQALQTLIDFEYGAGFVVTVELVPTTPLRMRGYRPVVHVRQRR